MISKPSEHHWECWVDKNPGIYKIFPLSLDKDDYKEE